MARLKERAEGAARDHRNYVVSVLLNGASFNEVSKATGLSKDTLQRWKREAGGPKIKVPKSIPRRSREQLVAECPHEWELRPESDTWVCLFCAEER